jgi:hypothetical protein
LLLGLGIYFFYLYRQSQSPHVAESELVGTWRNSSHNEELRLYADGSYRAEGSLFRQEGLADGRWSLSIPEVPGVVLARSRDFGVHVYATYHFWALGLEICAGDPDATPNSCAWLTHE